MARYAKLTIVCGRRATGKTNKTLSQLYTAVRNGRKALIFDAKDEFGNYIYRPDQPPHSIKAIYLKDVPRFTAQTLPEIVRIRPFLDNGQRMTTEDLQLSLGYVLKNYRGGVLLAEDINVYIADNTPNDLMGSLATLRQAGVDLIAHYQMIGKAGNPKMIGMANYIRLHKTNDTVERHADKFQDYVDILSIAEKIVERRYMYGMNHGITDATGQYFNCLVDLEYHKIRGIFTLEEAKFAVAEYISDSDRTTIKRLMNRKTPTGANQYTNYEAAYKHLEGKMMNDYFDFKDQ